MALLVSSTGEFGDLTLESTSSGIRLSIVKDGATVATSLLSAENAAQIALLNSIDTTSTPKKLVDEAIALTGLNRTAALSCDGAINFDLILTLGTAATPPTIQLNGSEDGISNWRPLGDLLVGVASAGGWSVTDGWVDYTK